MALYTLISATPLSVSVPNHHVLPTRRRFLLPLATLGSESSASTPTNSSPVVNGNTLTSSYGTRKKDPDDNSLTARFFRSTESNVERVKAKSKESTEWTHIRTFSGLFQKFTLFCIYGLCFFVFDF